MFFNILQFISTAKLHKKNILTKKKQIKFAHFNIYSCLFHCFYIIL